jgi:hypothetical protein
VIRLRVQSVYRMIACAAALAIGAGSASAQWMGKQTGCRSDATVATPNRPTVSNTALVTQYGVLELEYGWDRLWPEEHVTQYFSESLLKFGLLCDVDIRWSANPFLSQEDQGGTYRTGGDNWFGSQATFHRQTRALPSMAVNYSVKVPSASTKAGLGSGYVDHSFTFGASENVGQFTFDFNLTHLLAGRPGPGFDQNEQLALAGSRPIWRGLGIDAEIYGATELNSGTPAFVSSLGALTWTVLPRLVLDGGYEAGITSGGPHRHVFGGVTWAIANLYPRRRKR